MRIVWVCLIGLTLLSSSLAESHNVSVIAILSICAVISVKGILIIDYLMGLRFVSKPLRYSVLSYFILLPPLIALTFVFPDIIVRLTAL